MLDKRWPPQLLRMPKGEVRGFAESSCFFLSSEWFVNYVCDWSEKHYFAQWTRDESNSAAFAFLGVDSRASRVGVRYKSLGFNETGDQLLQNITLEFNDFLSPTSADDQNEPNASNFRKNLDFLLDDLLKSNVWDELRMGALLLEHAKVVQEQSLKHGLIFTEFSIRKSYWIDFDSLSGLGYLESRSANTRSQLRRALKSTEKALGHCKVALPSSLDEALLWLDQLGVLHQLKWSQTGQIEGFQNPVFVSFQKKMVRQMWETGAVQILKISAGEAVLGYLHFYFVKGVAYFNFCGINYYQRQAAKPGLICHLLAIEYFRKMGASKYDFMGGTNQYKESLCTHHLVQQHCLVRRKRWFFILENWLRLAKRSLKK